jgi:hypothetical protein
MQQRRHQEQWTYGDEHGYSLVVLAAGITIMFITMGVAIPSWQHVMQDDREQEPLFRGGQIADAIHRWSDEERQRCRCLSRCWLGRVLAQELQGSE